MEANAEGEEYFSVSVDWHQSGDEIELSSDVSDGTGQLVAVGPSDRFEASPQAISDSLEREIPALQGFIREQAGNIGDLLASHVIPSAQSPPDVEIRTWDIPSKILDRIRRGIPSVPGVVVLPSLGRGAEYFYAPDDVQAAQAVRAAGVQVLFADTSNRRFLSEFSAGEVVTIALAVAENLSSNGLLAVGEFLLARAGLILDQGLSLAGDVEMEVRVARLGLTPEGVPSIDGLHVRGPALPTTLAVLTALAGQDAANALFSRLERTSRTGYTAESQSEDLD
ncbi:hypothetical protein [Euzebya pacifica]|jgi:hypothetical protein|uniref:hypothetical protein n=1 Tax=Euzebya pacifica TaxID=1608957 RepID=UPI0030F899EF